MSKTAYNPAVRVLLYRKDGHTVAEHFVTNAAREARKAELEAAGVTIVGA